MRKNQPFSIQVRFYTQGEPCYTVSINEVCVWADAFDCVCVCRGADILPFPLCLSCWRQRLTSFIKDCEGELSDKTQVTTAEGYPSALPLNVAPFKLPQLRQGRRLQNREKNTGKPTTGLLYFVTETRCCLCSIAQQWQCPWSMKIKSHLPLIFLNLVAYET